MTTKRFSCWLVTLALLLARLSVSPAMAEEAKDDGQQNTEAPTGSEPAPAEPGPSEPAPPAPAPPAPAPPAPAPPAPAPPAPAPPNPPAASPEPKPKADPKEPKKVDDAQRAEAAKRFERALRLFEANDNAGSLAEFKRTYEIIPNPVVLYNIGLVYAAMQRPVDAAEALESSLKSGALSPGQRARAEQTLGEQLPNIGRLTVITQPEGARIEIDNVMVATSPLASPLRVSAGSHIVGAVLEGYAPARKEVIIAGNSEGRVELELVPTDGKRLANLRVRTAIHAADVVIDGEVVGKTPLSASITVVAGRHLVELRRAGYLPSGQAIEVGPGATGELTFDLRMDQSSLGKDGGFLVIDSSESPFDVTVNGERMGAYREPLRLPKGPHRIGVAAAGFFPVEREVELDAGSTQTLTVKLDPTPETREKYQSSARAHRNWGWVGVVSGAVIAGGGATLAILGSKDKEDARSDLQAINVKIANNEPPCDARSGYAAEMSLPPGQQGSYLCDKATSDARANFDSAQLRMNLGYVGAGVGSALLVTGVILLLTGDDIDRYESAPHTASLGRDYHLTLAPSLAGTGASLRLDF